VLRVEVTKVVAVEDQVVAVPVVLIVVVENNVRDEELVVDGSVSVTGRVLLVV